MLSVIVRHCTWRRSNFGSGWITELEDHVRVLSPDMGRTLEHSLNMASARVTTNIWGLWTTFEATQYTS